MNMNTARQPKKRLPIKIAWLGPPSGRRGFATIEANLLLRDVEVVKKIDDDIMEQRRLPQDAECAVVCEGMIRGNVLKAAKDLALRSGVKLIYVTPNADITVQRLRDAGIVHKLVDDNKPAPLATLNNDRPLSASFMDVAKAKVEVRAEEPKPEPPKEEQKTQAPEPPKLVVVGGEEVDVSEYKNNRDPIIPGTNFTEAGVRARVWICEQLSTGPSKEADLQIAAIRDGLTTRLSTQAFVNGLLHWLEREGIVEVVEKKAHYQVWRLIGNIPTSDDIIAIARKRKTEGAKRGARKLARARERAKQQREVSVHVEPSPTATALVDAPPVQQPDRMEHDLPMSVVVEVDAIARKLHEVYRDQIFVTYAHRDVWLSL